MTPADKRMLELLDRWLVSIDLHLKYLDLDEASYRQVQPWPEHERPARWILELAQQKISQLKTLCRTYAANNDPSFAEGMDLMYFLANLVGIQNIKRYIPLADPARENRFGPVQDTEATGTAPATPKAKLAEEATRELPRVKAAVTRAASEAEHTREMPKLKPGPAKKTATVTPRNGEPSAKKSAKPDAPAAAENASGERAQELVVADAVRLLKWGRQWHELTELIARMAERPGASEIRRILRTHKVAIEAQLRN